MSFFYWKTDNDFLKYIGKKNPFLYDSLHDLVQPNSPPVFLPHIFYITLTVLALSFFLK